ncbi:MAG TPA: NAD-dependent epimerase/dehydratase family protein [Acidimicrobiia bacterium]|nr:NAD-dependent epimerase/dehydratase family protein [Acidimicrobiia bacterium]HIL47126.1 NAD-dependent epimerase/dehydratase family protein [Acidimicrobiia bacterium]
MVNSQKPRVVVTGSTGAVGRQVCTRLADEGFSVVGLDRRSGVSSHAEVSLLTVDLAVADLRSLLMGADVVVHLASGVRAQDVHGDPGHDMLTVAERLLAAAADAGVAHVVVRSSAMVYGAWADNPVPLTEEAGVQPCRGFRFAEHRASLEGLATAWAGKAAGRSASLLRPAVTVAEERPGGLARILASAAAIRAQEGDPLGQFVHADDLAEAVVCVVAERFDGPVNVAPDGWISAPMMAELGGPAPRLRLPAPVASWVAEVRWQLGLTDAPPSVVPYTVFPWVVANDRLRSLGWVPSHSNEEAYVVGYEPRATDRLDAKRRQQLSLAVAGGAVLLGLVILGRLVGRWRKS